MLLILLLLLFLRHYRHHFVFFFLLFFFFFFSFFFFYTKQIDLRRQYGWQDVAIQWLTTHSATKQTNDKGVLMTVSTPWPVLSPDVIHGVVWALTNKYWHPHVCTKMAWTPEVTLELRLGRSSRRKHISESPRMFHPYLSISCVSSGSFPAGLSVLVFQVPMVMLSLPRIFNDAPVAYLTPPSWCAAEGACPYSPGRWPIWYGMVDYCYQMVRRWQSTAWRSPSLSR